MEVAFVYVISAKVDDDQWPRPFYKIGFSINPHWRLSELGIKNAAVELEKIAPCHYSHRVRLEKLAHTQCEKFWVHPSLVYSLLETKAGNSEWFYFKDSRDALGFQSWWKYEFTEMARRSFGSFVFESLQESLDLFLES